MAELTVNEAFNANQQLQKQQLPGGRTVKPDILNAKGDAGMALYFLKHSIKDAFKAHFERVGDLLQEKQELQKDQADLEEKKQENKTGLSDKDSKRLKEVKKKIKSVNEELDEISQKTEEVDIKKQVPLQGIKNYADVDALEALDFAIDFGEE